MSALSKYLLWISIFSVVIMVGGLTTLGLLLISASSASANCLPLQSAVETGEVEVGDGSAVDAYFARTPQPGVIAQKQTNAAIIISVGREMGLSDYSVAIGVATAIQESGLINLPYGDRDSLGLFQQRPSVRSWGTAEEIMDPAHAATAFFERLQTIPNRDQMPMMEAAILVQIPNRFYYERDWEWDAVATELVTGTPSDQNMCAGWVAPLGPGAPVSSLYGMRQLSDEVKPKLHAGIDFPAPAGTEIRAASSGIIVYAGTDIYGGNYLAIDHGNNITTGYAHMTHFAPGLSEGVHVNAGQVIAYVGSTGRSTGNHLHFEVIVDGEKVDPLPFMRDRGVDFLNQAESSSVTQYEPALSLSLILLQESDPVPA